MKRPELKSTIEDNQLKYLSEKINKKLGPSPSKEDLELAKNELDEEYLNHLGEPLYKKELFHRGQVPFVEDFMETMQDITADVDTLYQEHNNSSGFALDSFNYMHSEKKRLTSKMNGLNSLVGDLNLIAKESDKDSLYFKESFEDPKSMDTDFQISSIDKAQVSSNEGVLTLGRSSSENLSLGADVASIQGNGDIGTNHLARRIQIEDENGRTEEKYIFTASNEETKNDDVNAILDNRADTILEYQMVNVPDSFISKYKRYDFGWVKGDQKGETLRLKLVVELDGEQTINWINVNPYHPANSTNKVNVYSIRTSKDGFEYEGLFEKDNYVINSELNENSQTYRLDELFDGSNDFSKTKFTNQGVWAFPSRQARFVEFVFDQTDSYREIIGQEIYSVRTKDQDFWTQIPKVTELEDQEPGEYTRYIDGVQTIYKKEVIASENGWRYAIGLRDINIMSYRFKEKSSFISKRYEVDGEISKVMLYSNEKIPESYQTVVKYNNDWITYEVSFDDINWFSISPMHHEPLNDNFPAKILELNGNEVDLTSAFQVHKDLIKTDTTPDGIRLRVTLNRPEDIEDAETTTPLLEDYSLRVVRKEQ